MPARPLRKPSHTRPAPAARAKPPGASLLVELLTEELPPKSLARLSEVFRDAVFNGLKELGLLAADSAAQAYATPRRLAVCVTGVLEKQPDRMVERRGPAVSAGLDANGQPTPALLGFAKSSGVAVSRLERQQGDKGEYFVSRAKQKGEPLKTHLAPLVEAALRKLPVAKLMRWGAGEAEFVRPVHGLVMLHGRRVVPGVVLGLKSGNKTLGHRSLSTGTLSILRADDYERVLRVRGKVIAAIDQRRAAIEKQLRAAADKLKKGSRVLLVDGERLARVDDDSLRAAEDILHRNSALLDEVAALVEWPKVYAGTFDPAFLEVPIACLGLSMQQHQRYFPLVHMQAGTRMLPVFLVVSNNETPRPQQIIHGNERVLRARLSDARFFFDQDRKTALAERTPRLANVVYHNKLGSQLERVQRIQKLAVDIARRLADTGRLPAAGVGHVERAAWLGKADLLSDMVGEFPELQGAMGAIYARHDGEPAEVAEAIRDHYAPRHAGDDLPATPAGTCLALADRLDTLVGIYGIGLVPTGDKDPYGLRRAALGVVRMLIEQGLPLDVLELLSAAQSGFAGGQVADGVAQDLHGFMLERVKPYVRDQGFEFDEIDAVLSLNPTRLDQLHKRLAALQDFRRLPEAEALAAANKRIRNILRQAGGGDYGAVDSARLAEPAEQRLAEQLGARRAEVLPLYAAGDYAAALKRLAGLREVVDAFFDKVMVMAEDAELRRNRLALLAGVSALFVQAADISKLQPRVS